MAEITPESDLGSIECFQNYTAPEVFIQGLAGLVNQQDVEAMIRAQKQMLQRFEKTNEMLINCNALSAGRLQTAGAEFKKHSQLLLDMKKDLDNIFKRIRVLKTKLNSQYPQAFTGEFEILSGIQNNAGTVLLLTHFMTGLFRLLLDVANQAALVEEEEEAKEACAGADAHSDPPSPDAEEVCERPPKRCGSSSTDSNNGNSNNDSSPCTSDTG